MPTVVETAHLILTNLGGNNNKFYRLSRYDNHSVESHYGRVGDRGQKTLKQFDNEWRATSFFQSTLREKERKGYRPVQTIEDSPATRIASKAPESLQRVALDQIRYTSPLVKELVAYLTEKNTWQILEQTTMTYDSSRGTFSTPLGIVTQEAIDTARKLLRQMAQNAVQGGSFDRILEADVNLYLTLIPTKIGRQRQTARDIFPDVQAFQKQNALLDSLEASLNTVLAAPAAEGKPAPKLFDVQLELVEDGKEIDRIRKKFHETAQSMHESRHLDVKTVYLLEISAMKQAFEKDGAKLPNIWELWHGSRVGNLLSILKNGFVIPPANSPHCTGRMFGNGTYFSDQSTKALNYSFGTWSGSSRDSQPFMFLCNVAMGNYWVPPGPTQTLPYPGTDSTFAQAEKSGVRNNEMIVPRTSQVDPVFIVQFSPKGR